MASLLENWKNNRSGDDFNGDDPEFAALVAAGVGVFDDYEENADEWELWWNLAFQFGMRMSVPAEAQGNGEILSVVIRDNYAKHGTNFGAWKYGD